MATKSQSRAVLAAILALGLTVLLPSYAMAQEGAASDSAKQAEAMKAMEAAADSARNAARRGRPPAPVQPSENAVVDTAPGTVTPTQSQATESTPTTADTSMPNRPTGDSLAAQPGSSTLADTNASQAAGADSTREEPTTPAVPVDPKAPYKNVKFAPDEKPHVLIQTTMGNIVVELWPNLALAHCQNFVYLAQSGFYDSLTFHRVVPGFVIQAGDPEGTGAGGPGYSVSAEFSTKLLHEEGTLSMARRVDPLSKTGGPERPEYTNSAGSQFFICLDRAASLDGKYSVFGKVVEGLDVVHRIAATPAQRERPITPVLITKMELQPQS